MIYLLDTHVLLWAVGSPEKLSAPCLKLLKNERNTLVFSAASLWEIAIKTGLGRPDFQVSPAMLRRSLLEHGYQELAIHGRHAVAVANLPALHKDPFDRILVAQAQVEACTLLTNDAQVAQYPGPIQTV